MLCRFSVKNRLAKPRPPRYTEREGNRKGARRLRRLIFHVDVNSAYLSWESVRRLSRGESDLRQIPAAIGGDRDKRTGVILAKSIPAKAFGVRTGEPVAMALRKCPELTLARPDHRLYERCSQAFLAVCRDYTPVVEQFSIDECFLDMTGTEKLYPDPLEAARQIRVRIRDSLGFTVNIGVSENKLLAKMASDFEKPDKVHTLYPSEVPRKLWPLPVGELYSVGRSTAERLQKARIETIGALAAYDLRALQALLGVKAGLRLHEYANGIDRSPVLAEPEEAKGYSISTTLEQDVTTLEQAHRVLSALAESVAAHMRSEDAKSSCISVSIRSNAFQNRSHQKKLAEPTDITTEIYGVAKRLFSELWDGTTPLRLLGISLTDITRGGCEQTSLFADERRERARKLDQTVDSLRSRFGAGSIARGSAIGSDLRVGRKYQARDELKRKRGTER